MHHFKSPVTFYAAAFVLSAWTAMLFGLSANQLLTQHYEGAVYSALSLDTVGSSREASTPTDSNGLVNGSIAPSSRYFASVSPVSIELGTDGNERYEIIKDGAVVDCIKGSINSDSGNSCDLSKGRTGEKGSAFVINKADIWADALPGTSWISFKKGSASNKSGVADGTVVRFTKKVKLSQPVSSGVIALMADDNVRVLVNGEKIYGTGLKNRALVKQPEVITVGALKKGENTFDFEVTQNDKASNKPFGLNAKILLLQAPEEKSSQTIASGSNAVRLATTLFYSVAPRQDLRSLVVTLTRESAGPWSFGNDAVTKDFRNIRLVDETNGNVLVTASEVSPSYGCTVTGKTATCTFGSLSAVRMSHPITAAGFGEVKGLSVYADVLPTNKTKKLSVKILPGKNNLVRTDTKAAINTPASVSYSLDFAPASSPVILACVDTIDNDGDGKIDAEDVGCQSPSVPTESDDNEADDQAVLKEVSTLRNAARTNALKQIADAIDAFVKANNNKWECVAGPLPMASKPISSATGGYNLATCLVPQYLSVMPVDPLINRVDGTSKYFWTDTNNYNTGFNLAYSSTAHKIALYAFNAELGQQIRYEYELPFDQNSGNTPPVVVNPPVTPPGEVGGGTRPVPSAPVLTLNSVAGQAVSKVLPGASNVDLLKFSLVGDTKSEIVVTRIIVTNAVVGGVTGKAFTSYVLYSGSNRLNAVPTVTTNGNVITVAFDVANFSVQKGQTKNMVLRAAAVSNGNGLGSRNVFAIAKSGVVSAAKDNSSAVEVKGGATGPTIEVTPIQVSLGKSVNGATTNRVRSSNDDLINLSITGSTVAPTSLKGLKLTLRGSALGSAFKVSLVGPRKEAISGAAPMTCSPDGAGFCTVTFSPNVLVERGRTVGVKILVDSSNFNNVAGSSEGLEVSIDSPSDVVFDKGATVAGFNGALILAQVNYQ